MNKIGFAIKYASQGIATPVQINANGSWEKGVIDLRYIMFNVRPEVKAEGRCVILLTFDARGCYVAIARAISGRPNDFASGWLYIPADMQISGAEVQQMLGVVRNAISANDLSPFIPQLEQMFARTYPQRPAAQAYRPSNPRGQLAGRDVRAFNLETLLGEGRYQPYYADYQCVFLVSDFAQTLADNVVNITDQPLVETFTVMPPRKEDVNAVFGPGVQIFTADGVPFTQPMCAEKGTTMQFRAVRSGYADITFSHRVTVDGASVTMPRSNRWLRHIGPGDIRVFEKSNRRPIAAEVRVNDAIIGQTGMDYSEDDLRNAHLHVSAPGYESYQTNMPLDRLPIEVFLVPASGAFTANVLLSNGTMGRVTVDGKRLEPGRSPLEGYTLEGRNLRYSGSTSGAWIQRAIGFGAGVVLCAAIWGCVALLGGKEEKASTASTSTPIETTQEGTQPSAQVTENASVNTPKDLTEVVDAEHSRAKAIEYVKTKPVFNRTEMEKYPDLKGLWDDMNAYNFETLVGDKWSAILKEAGRDKLIEEIQFNIKNKTRTKFPATFNAAGDENITYKNYLNTVSNARKNKYPSSTKASPKNNGDTKRSASGGSANTTSESTTNTQNSNGGGQSNAR